LFFCFWVRFLGLLSDKTFFVFNWWCKIYLSLYQVLVCDHSNVESSIQMIVLIYSMSSLMVEQLRRLSSFIFSRPLLNLYITFIFSKTRICDIASPYTFVNNNHKFFEEFSNLIRNFKLMHYSIFKLDMILAKWQNRIYL